MDALFQFLFGQSAIVVGCIVVALVAAAEWSKRRDKERAESEERNKR
jgi:uncharacterized membrane protein